MSINYYFIVTTINSSEQTWKWSFKPNKQTIGNLNAFYEKSLELTFLANKKNGGYIFCKENLEKVPELVYKWNLIHLNEL